MVGLIKFLALVFGLTLVQSCSTMSYDMDKEMKDRRIKESLKMFEETHKVRRKLSKRNKRGKLNTKKRYYS
jgi:hypothetical protein